MRTKKYLKEIKLTINSYKGMIFYFEEVLKIYSEEDKIYLFFELKELKKKLKILESLIINLKKFSEKTLEYFKTYCEKYFQEFQAGFLDFLIFLKWSNFGAVRMKLQAICREKSSISSIDRANYKVLLNMLINEI